MSERGCRARGWERSLLSKNSEVQQMKTERKEDSQEGLKAEGAFVRTEEEKED